MFSCCEGDLRNLFWKYSIYELKKAIELKIGETYASHMTQFSVIAEVVGQAFGGGKSKKPDIDVSGASPEVWQAQVNKLFSGGI